MKMYNSDTDTLIERVTPFFKSGRVSHYVAKNSDTKETITVTKEELKEYQDTRYVDYETLRGMSNEVDDFILATAK